MLLPCVLIQPLSFTFIIFFHIRVNTFVYCFSFFVLAIFLILFYERFICCFYRYVNVILKRGGSICCYTDTQSMRHLRSCDLYSCVYFEKTVRVYLAQSILYNSWLRNFHNNKRCVTLFFVFYMRILLILLISIEFMLYFLCLDITLQFYIFCYRAL